MIVYNVMRKFFAEKVKAERYRIDQGLPPSATTKLAITDRVQLAHVLTALCEPGKPGSALTCAAGSTGLTSEIVDAAFVELCRDVPAFLRDECIPRSQRAAWERFQEGGAA